METRRLISVLPMLLGLGLFVGVTAWVVASSVARGFTIDFDTYAAAAQRLLDGRPLYAPEQLTGPYRFEDVVRDGYVYPPPSVLLFVPFLALGFPAWALLNAVLLATGLVAAARRELGRHSPAVLAVVFLALAVCYPYFEGLGIGNANVGIAGVFAWGWALGRGRTSVPGALLGLLKLAPGALVAFTDRERFPKTLALALAVTVLVAAVTLPLVGLQSWLDYAAAVRNAVPRCEPGPAAVPPLSCALAGLVGDAGFGLAILVATVLVAGAVVVRGDLASFGLVVAASLAPLAELHLHTWLFPIVFVAIGGFRLVALMERRADAARLQRPAAETP